jgi:predicted adenylyl cyclase CyaB
MTDNQKNIEVEMRALVKDMGPLQSAVEKVGAIYKSENSLHDIYFCDKSINSVEEVEMHDVGSYSLRLRKYSNDTGAKISLNTKTITRTGDHNAWEEHETMVENFKETAKILVATEFKPYFELEKIRREYVLGELSICLEDIKDFGACIEVEIITSPGDEDTAKERILQFLSSVGVTRDAVVPKSVTNIVMKERAFKANVDLETINAI